MDRKAPLRATHLGFIGDVATLSEPMLPSTLAHPVVINLEGPLSKDGPPQVNKINLWSDPEQLKKVFPNGIAAASLANNHIVDFGLPAFQHTADILEQWDVTSYGAGRANNGYANPGLIRVGDHTVALLGYVCPTANPVFGSDDTTGAALLSDENVARDIDSALGAGASYVIVTPHWGVEQVERPRPADVLTARRIIDMGAHAVIGHHGHCIQGYEVYRGRHIVYGLGSTVWPNMRVESEFGNDGKPRNVFNRRQRFWNRRSMLAELNVQSGDMKLSVLKFRDGLLTVATADVEKWNMGKLGTTLLDENAFRKFAQRQILRDRLSTLLHERRLPKIRALYGWRGVISDIDSQTADRS